MIYYSKNPINQDEIDMNLFLIKKYSFSCSNELLFEISFKIFLLEINNIGIENILSDINSNAKINKIKNLIFLNKTKTKFKNLFITDYLKESFFKKHLKLIIFFVNKQ